ncbi:hypothetical protein ACRN9T_19075 [Shewanella baltica]|uniref:hypothetical protein n=1 Tax=Shewanella baltica TaxID=62322 RepID=UPI003D7906BD
MFKNSVFIIALQITALKIMLVILFGLGISHTASSNTAENTSSTKSYGTTQTKSYGSIDYLGKDDSPYSFYKPFEQVLQQQAYQQCSCACELCLTMKYHDADKQRQWDITMKRQREYVYPLCIFTFGCDFILGKSTIANADILSKSADFNLKLDAINAGTQQQISKLQMERQRNQKILELQQHERNIKLAKERADAALKLLISQQQLAASKRDRCACGLKKRFGECPKGFDPDEFIKKCTDKPCVCPR